MTLPDTSLATTSLVTDIAGSPTLPAGSAGTIEAVCVVSQLRPDPGSVGTTGIDKRPVDGPVPVAELGMYGDVQADRKHHGGADQAVYALDAAESAHWAEVLGREVPAGSLGENLHVGGFAVDDLELGARVRVGTALLEVTAPRTPCATFARWIGRDDFRAMYHERGRTGVYFRVLRPGAIRAGDAMVVDETPGHGITVAGVYRGARDRDQARRLADWSRSSGIALHRELQRRVERLAPAAA
ncbi:MOSC domain-containing protein [Brachybacterium sp. GCM10030267]|uniref:MOSC domain-containing protein n=1 Tax=Brachybacterium sp. GCM10030267 TaxID=3273381 RepID=UPI003612A0DB